MVGLTEEIAQLAKSPSWEDRARAGATLASYAGAPEVDDLLVALVLDELDTGVTVDTAWALLTRHDIAAIRVLLRAWEQADDDADEELCALASWDDGDDDWQMVRPMLESIASDSTDVLSDAATKVLEHVGSVRGWRNG